MKESQVRELFKSICDKLGLEDYVLNISNRFTVNYANASVWDFVKSGIREINISKKYIHSTAGRIKCLTRTIIHEIAHFKQFEETLNQVKDPRNVLPSLRTLPHDKGEQYPPWHNKEFYRIMEELKEKINNENLL